MAQLLIDGDLFLYKATASAEFESDMGDDVWFLSTNLQKAKDHWMASMDAVTRKLESDDVVVVLSGPHNFRKDLDPTYKQNRAGVRKPLGFKHLKGWLEEMYPDRVKYQEILEADDYMGILATAPNAPERIIVSEDKDMRTLPCRLFQKGELVDIDEDSAELYWLTQTLTGDSADGYKGCPGIGAVKAKKLLEGRARGRWDTVLKAFHKAGCTTEDAILQARLARILRHSDWDGKTKTPILWTPEGFE